MQSRPARIWTFLDFTGAVRRNKKIKNAADILINLIRKPLDSSGALNAENSSQLTPDNYCFDNSDKATIHNTNVYLNLEGISARYNLITHKPEYSGYNAAESKDHINENIITLLFDTMQHDFKKCSPSQIRENLNVITTRNKFNPVLEKLNGITWDGTDRLETVYEIFGIDEADELSRVLMRKWFMQCICLLHNTLENPFHLRLY